MTTQRYTYLYRRNDERELDNDDVVCSNAEIGFDILLDDTLDEQGRDALAWDALTALLNFKTSDEAREFYYQSDVLEPFRKPSSDDYSDATLREDVSTIKRCKTDDDLITTLKTIRESAFNNGVENENDTLMCCLSKDGEEIDGGDFEVTGIDQLLDALGTRKEFHIKYRKNSDDDLDLWVSAQ